MAPGFSTHWLAPAWLGLSLLACGSVDARHVSVPQGTWRPCWKASRSMYAHHTPSSGGSAHEGPGKTTVILPALVCASRQDRRDDFTWLPPTVDLDPSTKRTLLLDTSMVFGLPSPSLYTAEGRADLESQLARPLPRPLGVLLDDPDPDQALLRQEIGRAGVRLTLVHSSYHTAIRVWRADLDVLALLTEPERRQAILQVARAVLSPSYFPRRLGGRSPLSNATTFTYPDALAEGSSFDLYAVPNSRQVWDWSRAPYHFELAVSIDQGEVVLLTSRFIDPYEGRTSYGSQPLLHDLREQENNPRGVRIWLTPEFRRQVERLPR